jgi:hypothetical protein
MSPSEKFQTSVPRDGTRAGQAVGGTHSVAAWPRREDVFRFSPHSNPTISKEKRREIMGVHSERGNEKAGLPPNPRRLRGDPLLDPSWNNRIRSVTSRDRLPSIALACFYPCASHGDP